MALTWQEPGAVSVDTTTPMLITNALGVAGDILIIVIGMKPTVANSGGVTTPADWTLLGTHVGGGYGATLAADTGNTHLFVYYRILTGSAPASTSFVITNSSATWGQCYRITATSGQYSIAMATGEDTSAGNVSVTFGSNPGVTTGDLVIGALSIATDITTPAQFSAHNITQTGVTFGTVTEVTEYDSGAGNDVGGYAVWAPVSSGTGSANPVMTATAGGTTTNVRGPGVFIRVREVVPTGYTLTVDSAAIGYSAPAVNFSRTRQLTVDPAAYSLSTGTIILAKGYKLSLETPNISVTATDVTLTYTPASGVTMTIDSGTFIMTSYNVGLRADKRLPITNGTLVFTGNLVNLLKKVTLGMTSLSLGVVTPAVGLFKGNKTIVETSALPTTMNPLAFRKTWVLGVESGEIRLNTPNVQLSYSGEITVSARAKHLSISIRI